MNRYWALLLAFMLLLSLLASCEMIVPAPSESVRPNFGLPAGSDSSASTETADPTADEYGFTIFPEGNYLADSKFDTDEFLPDYDADLSFVQYFSTGDFGPGTYRTPVLCSTDDTVYFFDGDSDLILFWDKATGISSPLCGRPECLHNSGSCNAYVPTPNGLRVYEGKLYWTGERMNLDGTNRELGPWTINTESMNSNLTTVIHRGYVYTAGAGNIVTGGTPGSTVTVNVTAMDGSESFTLLSKVVDGVGGYCTVRPVGNDLYILVYYLNYIDDKDPNANVYTTVELYRWDAKTRQVEFLYKGAEEETGLTIDYMSFQPVLGDGVYLKGYRTLETESGLSEDVRHYVCKYSFDNGDMEELFWFDDEKDRYYDLSYTNDYVLVEFSVYGVDEDYEHTLFVYDYVGNLVLTKYLGAHSFSYTMGVDNEFIYGARLYSRLQYHDYFLVPLDGGEIVVIE